MMETRLIYVNRTLALLGLLLLIILGTSNIVRAQCPASPVITVDPVDIDIYPFGNNSCWIEIPYRVINPGPCEISSFETFVSVTTPEGTENTVTLVPGPIAVNIAYNGTVGFASALLHDNIDDVCFTVGEISIQMSPSAFDPPTPITEIIDCPYGDGLVIACEFDNDIICDDSFCAPYDCSGNVGVIVDDTNISISNEAGDECLIEIPYSLTSSGTCDVGMFDVNFEITTIEGTHLITESFTGFAAGGNSTGTVSLSSNILEGTDGNCFETADIVINSSIPIMPDIMTTTLPCPMGNGTIEVCANNANIICDDSNCGPPTCDTNLEFGIDDDNLMIQQNTSGLCALSIPYSGVNLGACDLDGFPLIIQVLTPAGSANFVVNVLGPLAPGDSFSNNFTAITNVLSDGSGCYGLDEIQVRVSEDENNLPQPITTEIPCTSGLGTIVVCANNQNIICDDTGCEFVLAVDLLSFHGSLKEEKVNLEWNTLNEINTSHYNVQRGSDGSTFETIGRVDAKNFSEEVAYLFIDGQPKYGSNYYRLATIQLDGKIEYSDVIHIELEGKDSDWVIFPNPASHLMKISNPTNSRSIQAVYIHDSQGRLVATHFVQDELHSFEFDLSDLLPGLYFVELRGENYKDIQKLVKI